MASETTLSTSTRGAAAEPAPLEGTPRERSYYLEIFLVSLAALLLEISYTRIVSFKLFYYFTYLVIGLALMGIGSGGVIVAISGRIRRASTEAVMLWSALGAAAGVLVGYLVVARLSIDTFAIWRYGERESFVAVAQLVVLCLALFAPFFCVGVAISLLFSRSPGRINRLYFADLLGAGLACAVVVTLIGTIGPPATIFLAALIFAGTAVLIALRLGDRTRPIAIGLAVLSALAVVAPDLLPMPRVEPNKTDPTNEDFVFGRWSPIFRVDVREVEGEDLRLLYHDGLIGSNIFGWDGEQSSLSKFRFDEDVRVLPFATPSSAPEDVAIIGAAGGFEILASLYYEASNIDAIELNPVTYDLVTDRYAEFGGRVAEQPGVNYVNGDGRSFLARSDDEYDLIWFPAPDSYAASNAASAGAFVLSESYLYTSDAIGEGLDKLADDGIIATQFGEVDYENKPNRTARYVATARRSLEEAGVEDPSEHILVATAPTDVGGSSVSTILIKESGFTPGEVDSFVAALGGVEGATLRYAPGQDYPVGPASEIVTRSSGELDAFFDTYRYDVSAITDDRPFFWHFRPFGDVAGSIDEELGGFDREDTAGERVLLLLLVIAIVLAAVFLLLPFVAVRATWSKLPKKPLSALYFVALGFGFMFFEISLIQRLVLFLGYPTYSLTVTLMSLLIFLGVGSLLSGRVGDPKRALPALVVAIVALSAFYLFGLRPVTDSLLGLPLGLRVPIAFLLLAPLGICLGMFMPLGLGAVTALGGGTDEYVAWAWAINGFASVVGSVLTTVLAMTFGFQVVLALALVTYLVAILALRSLLAAAREDPGPVAVAPPPDLVAV